MPPVLSAGSAYVWQSPWCFIFIPTTVLLLMFPGESVTLRVPVRPTFLPAASRIQTAAPTSTWTVSPTSTSTNYAPRGLTATARRVPCSWRKTTLTWRGTSWRNSGRDRTGLNVCNQRSNRGREPLCPVAHTPRRRWPFWNEFGLYNLLYWPSRIQ